MDVRTRNTVTLCARGQDSVHEGQSFMTRCSMYCRYGSASDPLKMAVSRGLQRVWGECLKAGEPSCSLDNPTIQNFTWFLLKAPEHT